MQEPGFTQNHLKDMLNVSRSKRFEAAGGSNQKIGLNAFAIRKNVDVKRLKHQLWDHIHPKLDEINQKKKELEAKALNSEELKKNLLQNVLSSTEPHS